MSQPNLHESWRAECADCAFKMEAAQPETKNSAARTLGLPEPETCLLRNSNCVYAYWRMARRTADSGRLTEARQWAERALKLDPLFAASHYLIGLVHDELGETDAAIASIRKALYLDPRFVLAHFSISALYQRIGRRADAARHRAIAVRDAGRLAPNTVLMGSQDMTAQNLLEMTRGCAAVNSNA